MSTLSLCCYSRTSRLSNRCRQPGNVLKYPADITVCNSISALMLLVGQQERRPDCKNTAAAIHKGSSRVSA